MGAARRWTHLPEVSRVMLGMVTRYRATGDKRALATARELGMSGLERQAVASIEVGAT